MSIRIYGRVYPIPESLGTCPTCKCGSLIWQEHSQPARPESHPLGVQDAKRGKAWVCNYVKVRDKDMPDGTTETLREPCNTAKGMGALFDDVGLDEKLRLGVDVSTLRMTPFAFGLAAKAFRAKYRLFEWVESDADLRRSSAASDDAYEDSPDFAFYNHLMRQTPAPTFSLIRRARELSAPDQEKEALKRKGKGR